MKAVTLHQPWASLIARRVKLCETRTRQTHHRGPLAIHAGLRPPRREEWSDDLTEIVDDVFGDGFAFPLGAVVAVATVIESAYMTEQSCWGTNGVLSTLKLEGHNVEREMVCGGWGHGRAYWRLNNIVQIDPPVAHRGKQGLWELPYTHYVASNSARGVERERVPRTELRSNHGSNHGATEG